MLEIGIGYADQHTDDLIHGDNTDKAIEKQEINISDDNSAETHSDNQQNNPINTEDDTEKPSNFLFKLVVKFTIYFALINR